MAMMRSVDGFKLDWRKTDALRRNRRPFHKLQDDFFGFLSSNEQIFVSSAINDYMNAIGQSLCDFFGVAHRRKSIQRAADQKRWNRRIDLAAVRVAQIGITPDVAAFRKREVDGVA